jgi:hypothetical protein
MVSPEGTAQARPENSPDATERGGRGRRSHARDATGRNKRDFDDIRQGARDKPEFIWLERVNDAIAAALEKSRSEWSRSAN